MKRLLSCIFVMIMATSALAQTTIRIMGYGGEDPRIVARILNEGIADDLASMDITVQYEPLEGDYNAALTNALSAGTAADLVYIPDSTAPGIIASGQILPLDGLVDPEPFIDSLIDVYTVEGQLYGIPKDFNSLALFYNKDLFDEAEVDYPDADDTWADFAQKVRDVADLDDEVYGVCFPATFDRFGAFAFGTGWNTFDDAGSSDLLDARFEEAVSWYTGLVADEAAVQPSDIGAGWTGDCLATDNVGIAIEGAWILGFLRDVAPNLQFGTAPMPLGPSGERGNLLFTVAWGVNANSENQEEALAVLELLVSEKVQQFVLENGLALPSREALAENAYFEAGTPEAEANKVVFDGGSDGNVIGFQFGSVGTDWMQPVNEALSAVMTGQSDVSEALSAAQEQLVALLERASN